MLFIKLTKTKPFVCRSCRPFENRLAQEYGEQFSFAVPAGYGAAVAEGLFDSYFVGRDFDTLEEFYNGAQDGIANGELKSQSVYTIELAYRDTLLSDELSVGLDVYYEMHRDAIGFVERWYSFA